MTHIFNDKDFQQKLTTEPERLLENLKQVLQEAQGAIRLAFEAGAGTTETVSARAQLIDQILTCLFDHYFSDCAQNVSLIAVGGYGRGELHPASDIDLMLLLQDSETDQTREKLEQFLMLLWDSGLEIGHSVRTLEECVDEARKDITVMTNLMESRILSGNAALFNRLLQATGADQLWNSKDFFRAKLEEQTLRHRKFGDTAYNLEPDIKENPGGLRDLQMIGWVAKRHFGTPILSELVRHHFLSQAEYETLHECQTYLWKIRIHLHYITGRHEDRLLFDYQKQLAQIFGYEDGENNLAIEQFMQRYYRTVMELERLNELLLQLFRQKILYADTPEHATDINRRFHVINGYIAARHENIFSEHPSSLLEIFLILELHPEIRGVHAQTIRLIRENSHLIDDKFRASQTARQLFIDIITQPRGVTHELRRMNRYGILAAYIPAFDKIVGRMQYDLFHAYTVDQHTLFVVRNMRRLSVPNFAHEHPLASGIFHHLKKPELLYLAGLFHDIAKGRGGNHAELGAIDAEKFSLKHGRSTKDSQLVSWLVKKHLIMSSVAQRKDISDPEIIYNFAKEMGTLAHLDYLYLLTLCDMRATNPKQWNSWKDNLLTELYHRTAAALKAGLDNPTQRSIVSHENRTSASRILDRQGIMSEVLNELWADFSDDYFIYHSADEISWHSQTLLDTQQPLPRIKARINSRDEAEIFIYSKEKTGLFAAIVSTLEQLGLNIANARINLTHNHYALNSFKVLEKNGSSPAEQYRISEIVERLNTCLTQTSNPGNNQSSDTTHQTFLRKSRTQKSFSVKTRIRFEQLIGKDVTLLNIVTTDRPGLLASIAQAFTHCDIQIHHAKISTAGEKALDSFHITDSDNNPLLDDDSIKKLKASLISHINQLGQCP
ncbi:[Protein-PII] uridylyltransferase / [Protein-PII]-UMP uridylyl-removing enzyme [hydrothermal vent metagenome]|uniref:[Protein-PII] uridylyltransferase / [Protein-PII]-UMP uridylyl-removing enzyme n=1 Tax=hydrothermal vent metagenome TaxID=652676 RepID=A0A3B0XJF6_9ZZZZ